MGSDLFVGGIFVQAGAADAFYMARWNDEIDFFGSQNSLLQIEVTLDGGSLILRGSAPANTQIVLENSTDLVDWLPIGDYSGSFTYTGSASGARQFYRTRVK